MIRKFYAEAGKRLFGKINLTIPIFVFLLSGCGTYASFVPADGANHLDSPEEIIIMAGSPQFPYQVMGTIQVGGSSEKEITDSLKRKAYEVGADAIIDVVVENTALDKSKKSKGAYASSGIMWPVSKHKIGLRGSWQAKATAIRFIKQTKG